MRKCMSFKMLFPKNFFYTIQYYSDIPKSKNI